MPDIKEYATQMMFKENSKPSIEKEWKKDGFFLPGQIDDTEDESSGGTKDDQ